HQRHGDILRFASDRLLRGQRKAVARLERPSPLHLLAVASGCRDSAYRSRSVVASAGLTSEFALTNAVESASGQTRKSLSVTPMFGLASRADIAGFMRGLAPGQFRTLACRWKGDLQID